MWQRLRRFDYGFLLVLLICFLAVWPFLSRPDLPRETDAELHIFRLAELSRLVRGGELYPRWSPHFYYGYGYPIFNYYAPLAYYAGLLVELLPPFDAVQAVKVAFIVGLLLAGVGMYGFVRDNWGRGAGLVAAAAFVYAPYVQYVDPHARGDLAESLSFAAFPLALWALLRLRRTGRALPWLASVAAVAAVILAHNLMAMIFFALLSGWVAWQWLIFLRARRAGVKSRSGPGLWLLPGALLLGVGVSAFFWLPVALEQSAVNLSSLIGDGSHFDFRNHFLSLGELFGPAAILDWGATEQVFVFALGPAQWLLGLAGVVMILLGKVYRRAQALYFVPAALLLIVLMTSLSLPLWENVPLLPYLQFPWRLLGAAVAMLAVLAGIATAGLLSLLPEKWSRLSGWVPAVLVGIIVLLGLPLTQMPPWPEEFGGTTRKDVVDIELAGRWVGTTSTADFVPATVDVLPLPNNAVLWNFWEELPLERINRATLPRDATVAGGEVRPLYFRYAVESPRAFPLRFFVFAFPGWEVRVDGEPVEIELGLPEGFIVAPIPAGSHVVELDFAETPARRASWLLAGLSLAATVVAAIVLGRRRAVVPLVNGSEPAGWHDTPSLRPTTALVLGLILVHLLFLEPAALLRYHSANYVAEPAAAHLYADFGEQIALIGVDAPDRVRPGETFAVTLYWQAQQPLDINYQVFVHLLEQDRRTLVTQSDKLNPAGFPTKRWPTDKYVRDVHELTVPADTPPGDYYLTTGLWVQTDGWRLPLLDEAGMQVDDNYLLRVLPVE